LGPPECSLPKSILYCGGGSLKDDFGAVQTQGGDYDDVAESNDEEEIKLFDIGDLSMDSVCCTTTAKLVLFLPEIGIYSEKPEVMSVTRSPRW
jgi:hypothetical protein